MEMCKTKGKRFSRGRNVGRAHFNCGRKRRNSQEEEKEQDRRKNKDETESINLNF